MNRGLEILLLTQSECSKGPNSNYENDFDYSHNHHIFNNASAESEKRQLSCEEILDDTNFTSVLTFESESSDEWLNSLKMSFTETEQVANTMDFINSNPIKDDTVNGNVTKLVVGDMDVMLGVPDAMFDSDIADPGYVPRPDDAIQSMNVKGPNSNYENDFDYSDDHHIFNNTSTESGKEQLSCSEILDQTNYTPPDLTFESEYCDGLLNPLKISSPETEPVANTIDFSNSNPIKDDNVNGSSTKLVVGGMDVMELLGVPDAEFDSDIADPGYIPWPDDAIQSMNVKGPNSNYENDFDYSDDHHIVNNTSTESGKEQLSCSEILGATNYTPPDLTFESEYCDGRLNSLKISIPETEPVANTMDFNNSNPRKDDNVNGSTTKLVVGGMDVMELLGVPDVVFDSDIADLGYIPGPDDAIQSMNLKGGNDTESSEVSSQMNKFNPEAALAPDGKENLNREELIEIEEESETNKRKRRVGFSKGNTRKRIRNEKAWKRNVIKTKRNRGEEYINYKGKTVKERQIKVGCNDKCAKKCHKTFSEDERKFIFNSYWNLGDVNRQRDFIFKHVHQKIKARQRLRNKSNIDQEQSRRKFTLCYYFPKANGTKSVCQKFFIGTLGISYQVVKTVMRKGNEEDLGGNCSTEYLTELNKYVNYRNCKNN